MSHNKIPALILALSAVFAVSAQPAIAEVTAPVKSPVGAVKSAETKQVAAKPVAKPIEGVKKAKEVKVIRHAKVKHAIRPQVRPAARKIGVPMKKMEPAMAKVKAPAPMKAPVAKDVSAK